MRVEIEISEQKAKQFGYDMTQIAGTLKNLFAQYGIRCVSERWPFTFVDNGHEDDYSHLWIVIVGLLESPWFRACATACRWYDEEKEDDLPEDVLSQAWTLDR